MPWVGLDLDGCKYLVNNMQCSAKVQGDQLKMAVFFWYLVLSYLSSVRHCTYCVD